eukprot:600122-Amphidinium_carterae.1
MPTASGSNFFGASYAAAATSRNLDAAHRNLACQAQKERDASANKTRWGEGTRSFGRSASSVAYWQRSAISQDRNFGTYLTSV